MPTLQAFSAGATTAICAAVGPVAGRNANAVAAIAKFVVGTFAAEVTAAIGSAVLVDALRLADDGFTEVDEALFIGSALTANTTATVGSAIQVCALRNALALLASTRFAKEVIFTFAAQTVAAVVAANLAGTLRYTFTEPVCADFVCTAHPAGTATGVWTTLGPVTGGLANADSTNARLSDHALATSSATAVVAALFVGTGGNAFAAPVLGAGEPFRASSTDAAAAIFPARFAATISDADAGSPLAGEPNLTCSAIAAAAISSTFFAFTCRSADALPLGANRVTGTLTTASAAAVAATLFAGAGCEATRTVGALGSRRAAEATALFADTNTVAPAAALVGTT